MTDHTIVALVLLVEGVLAGVFLGSSLVEHAARRLEGPVWLLYKQAKEAVFGPVMPPFFGAGLLAAIGLAIWQPRPAYLAAAALMVAVLAITVIVHLPLNKLFQSWSASALPAGWGEGRRRWRRWNWLRCWLAIAAFALMMLASA